VGYLSYRLRTLSQALFNNDNLNHKQKISYIAKINVYDEVLNLVEIFKTDIKKREETKEMFDERAKEAGVRVIDQKGESENGVV
jgi:hypothetical protein